MRATIKDVAKLAGVSPATVSLVLNNRPVSITPGTRQAVTQAAETLNYRPNQLAVGLVTKKTNTLGLIIPDNSNLFFAAYSNGIELAASKRGYNVIFGNTNNAYEKSLHYLEIFADRGVDGIILAQSEFPNPGETQRCLDVIRDLRVPVILIDRVFRDTPLSCVVLDHFQGGYIATKHLIDLGHRRIACVTGPMGLTSCIDRLAGYRKALEEAEIPYDPTLLYEGNLQMESGIEALPYLLGKQVTAIFAFNDVTAYGLYKEMRSYNLRIPEDISIIGFDDIYFSDIVQPPLTTVAQPLEEMAQQVVAQLVAAIEPHSREAEEQKTCVFQPILKVRGSTRKLNAGGDL